MAILPLVLLWYYRRLSDAKPDMPAIALHLQDALLVKQQRPMWFAPIPLALLAIILTSIALAGPSWQKRPSMMSEDESILIIALDNSLSMQKTDISPKRWTRGLQKARDLVAQQPAGKIGVIAFAGSAHWIVPPTSDMSLVTFSLQGIDHLAMPLEGKLWPQISTPLSELLNTKEHNLSIVVVSDTALAKQLPEPWQDVYIANLLLSHESQTTRYDTVYVSPTDKDIKQLIRWLNRSFSAFQQSDAEWQDAGYLLVYPLLILGLLWFRPGWSMLWSLALIVCLTPTQSIYAEEQDVLQHVWFSGDQKGRWYFEQQNFSEAAKAFDDILWRGISHYQAKQFESAGEIFAQLDEPYARMMLANSLSQLGEYQRAITLYEWLDSQGWYPTEIANNLVLTKRKMAEQIALAESQQAALNEQENTEMVAIEGELDNGEGVASQRSEQLTANDILTENARQARWLQHISTDLGSYLGRLFALQQADGETP